MSFDFDNLDKPVDVIGGEWVGDIPGHAGMRLKVRSRTFKPFETAHNKLLRGYGKNAMKALEGDDYKTALGGLLVDHILLDWEKAVTKGGKDAKFDKAMAKKVLTSVDDRQIGENFRDAVSWCATQVAERHLGMVDDLVGN